MPETHFVLPERDFMTWVSYLDDGIPESDIKLLIECGKELGYPVFMRSDLSSIKHDYKSTCYVANPLEFESHLYSMIEGHAVLDIPMRSIVLRKYLPIRSLFHAFRGALPIGSERRYFVLNGAVVCHHPYWPPDSIYASSEGLPSSWRQSLDGLNYEAPDEVRLLGAYSEAVGACVPGAWSIDFARFGSVPGAHPKWYMIDMALAEHSWHPDSCSIKSQLLGALH